MLGSPGPWQSALHLLGRDSMAQTAVRVRFILVIWLGGKICLSDVLVWSLRKMEVRMRQKFQICLDGAGTHLNIREFAVIDKHLNIVESSMLEDKSFCLLCEETYDHATIADSISVGIGDLVTTLRTINFFPNHRYATQIAEAVVKLYASPGDGKIELFFDDKDMMKKSLAVFTEV
jgi:hypothetical protein